MPVLRSSDAVEFTAHGSVFQSYVVPSRGAEDLCAWRLGVGENTIGVPHRPTREEVILVLEGGLVVSLDGTTTTARAGDVVHVPRGTELRVDGGPAGATAWVTTTPGIEAVLTDGSRLAPPWAR